MKYARLIVLLCVVANLTCIALQIAVAIANSSAMPFISTPLNVLSGYYCWRVYHQLDSFSLPATAAADDPETEAHKEAQGAEEPQPDRRGDFARQQHDDGYDEQQHRAASEESPKSSHAEDPNAAGGAS